MTPLELVALLGALLVASPVLLAIGYGLLWCLAFVFMFLAIKAEDAYYQVVA